jgi:hypothetical protein
VVREMSVLSKKFAKLNQTEKAIFLARVAHEATVYARFSYVPHPDYPDRNFENPDAAILRVSVVR